MGSDDADSAPRLPLTPVRGSDGKFLRTLEGAERDAEAARLRSRSMSYRAIAAELGVPASSAYAMVQRALAEALKEPGEAVIQMELDKLDRLERAALGVLERKHLTVSHGKVIELDGVPLEDDGPVLAAVAQLRALSESRRKLLGLDAAQKLNLAGGVTYEIIGIDPDDPV